MHTVTCHAGELLPRLSTCTNIMLVVYFCCTFPEVSFGGRYPLSCSVMPGLSSCQYLTAQWHAMIPSTDMIILYYSWFVNKCFVAPSCNHLAAITFLQQPRSSLRLQSYTSAETIACICNKAFLFRYFSFFAIHHILFLCFL